MKKPAIIFTAADRNNIGYAKLFLNSLTKFHSPKDVDIVLWTDAEAKEIKDQLPEGIILEDVRPFLKDDPYFWYRQKPVLAERYINDYELVLGMDADQIVVADLSAIINTKDYDIGTVINWNRADPPIYGFVEIMRLGVVPTEYYNCGLVAMRSRQFIHQWKAICFGKEFSYMQYKEQDILNVLCHFGNYNVRCFDAGTSWYGLISKGEYTRAKLVFDKIVVPQGEGDQPFPPTDMTLRVLHAGGGNTPNKMNYRTWFSDEEIVKRLDYLVGRTP